MTVSFPVFFEVVGYQELKLPDDIDPSDRYLSKPELRKYKFSAVLWLNLRSQLSHELRRPKYHAEIVPWEETMQTALHDDDVGCDELWGELEKNLSKRNLEILFYSTQGNSYREIADACHLTIRAVACRLYRLRKKFREF